MANLEKGMYVKVIKELVFYDPHTLKPTTAALVGDQGEIVYAGKSLDITKEGTKHLQSVVNVSIKGKEIQFVGRMLEDFTEYFEVL